MATTDLLTLAEAKEALQITSVTQDALVASWVTAVSDRIDALCGPVVTRAVTERHDGGRPWVEPRLTPVAAVTSVVEVRWTTSVTLTAETDANQPADAYRLETDGRHRAVLWRRVSGVDGVFWPGRQNVVVSYTAGRVADTASVPPLFKRAAAVVLVHLWRQTAGAWALRENVFDPGGVPVEVAPQMTPWAVPRAALQLLAHELRAGAGAGGIA